jgi:hypothetical protein
MEEASGCGGCVAVLNFSEPARDPSFRSKAITAGLLILATMLTVMFTIYDSWQYFALWEFKGHQIILQVRHSFCLPPRLDALLLLWATRGFKLAASLRSRTRPQSAQYLLRASDIAQMYAVGAHCNTSNDYH